MKPNLIFLLTVFLTLLSVTQLPAQSNASDGTGSAARFDLPCGVAVDDSANVYVADLLNDTIRKITQGGVVTTLAGSAGQCGRTDGAGSAARFDLASGVAADGSGNVYVADTFNDTIRTITPDGMVTTLAGSAGQNGSSDGAGSTARFSSPKGVAVDGSGTVYVADSLNDTIRKIEAGWVMTTLAGGAGQKSSANGASIPVRFNLPYGVAVDSSGTVYVGDDGVAVDGNGNVYVGDGMNQTIRKITPGWVVTTLAGSAGQKGSSDGTGNAARFFSPKGVAVDGSGNVYVGDEDNNTIREITPGGLVTTLAGSPGISGNIDGTGSAARFSYPQGVAVDGSGNVYVASGNTIRKITPDGMVTTFAGSAGQKGNIDGTGSVARFSSPEGVAVDGNGNVYVASDNTIRKITQGGVVTTLAGSSPAP